MSAPKKGKDLSALKARLAKKAEEAEAPAAADVPLPGEAAAAVPAPGEVQKPVVADIPAPGEVKKPIDIPPPGEVSKPVDIPAPGEVRAPAPEPSRRGGDIADDPLSGGAAFDPSAGLIEDVGGEIKSGGGIGLPLFAGVVGIAIGVVLGWMGHKATDLRARGDAAKKKAATIEARVIDIEDTRAKIAMKVGAAKDALEAKDPQTAITELSALEPTFAELGDLFGWQMAAMDPTVIKAIFDLAESNNSLQLDVGLLKSWVGVNSEILSNRTAGPSSYVVIQSPNGGAVLAEYVAGICDEIPAELPPDFKFDSLKKCDDVLAAQHYLVRTAIGGEISVVSGEQAMILVPDGPIYTYAIAATPDAAAKAYFDIRMGRINEVLTNMNKLKDKALDGIGNYTSDPKVDASD